MRWALLVFIFVVAGCATFKGAGGPRSESGWYEVTTPHFVLYTDLDPSSAAEAAIDLERTRDSLIAAAWPAYHFAEPVRTRVFVLANGLDFERVFGRYIWGSFMRGKRPAFFLYGKPERWSKKWTIQQRASFSVLRHEMAHQLAAVVYSGAPRWFDEGIAQFLETVQVSDDGQSVIVGRTNVKALESFRSVRGVTLKRTLEWNEDVSELSTSETTGLYGVSWVFFHWLYNERPDAFSRYQLALAEHVDAKKAWESAFPGLDLDTLEPILYEYARHGFAAVDKLPFKASEPRVALRSMTMADAHAARAQIALAGAAPREDGTGPLSTEAKREVASALELDPNNVEALLLDDTMSPAERLRLVRSAAAVTPDDGSIQGLLGDLLTDPSERESAYRRALAASPDDPGWLNALAWLLVSQHRASEALPFALRALKRAPYDHDVLDTYAEVLSQMGRCRGAIDYEKRAVDRAREANERTRRRLSARLVKMKASCNDPGAPQLAVPIVATNPREPDAAEPPPEKPASREKPKHSGFYGALGVGLGYGSGTYATSGPIAGDYYGSFEGGGLNFDLAVGYGVLPGVALALEGGFVGQPDVTKSDNRPPNRDRIDTYGLVFMRVGGMVDGYLTPWFHLQGGVDWIRGSWIRMAWIPDETPTGVLAHASAGLAWRVFGYDLGPSLRIYRGTLTSDHSDASVFGVSGVVTAVWF